MSEEQKAWRKQLSNSREDFKGKVEEILQDLARGLLESPAKFSGLSKHVDAGVQTDTVEPTEHTSIVALNEVDDQNEPPLSNAMSIVTTSQMSEDAESLRLELAATSAQMMAQESSIRSLTQSTASLRYSIDEFHKERAELVMELQHTQLAELNHRSVRDRISMDLERATMEVDRLRDAIRTSHHPSSRIYQSVKDAVLREMKGEAPITPIILKRGLDIDEDREGDERAHKRQRGAPSNSAGPQGPLSQGFPPHRSSTLPEPPRLTIDTSAQARTMRPTNGHPNHQGPPSSERPSFNRGPMSAPLPQQPGQFTQYLQQSPSGQPGHRLPPQEQPVFTKQVVPSQRPPTINFVQSATFSAPLPTRGQNGHSEIRSRSSSNSFPNMPPPLIHLNSNQMSAHSQNSGRPLHPVANQLLQQPLSPGLVNPTGWAPIQVQDTRRHSSSSVPSLQQQQRAFASNVQINGGPITCPPDCSMHVHHPPIQQGSNRSNSHTIDLTSPTEGRSRPFPNDIEQYSTRNLITLLYFVDPVKSMMACKVCAVQVPLPPIADLKDVFTHSTLHMGHYESAYDSVFPPAKSVARVPGS